jgi:hypothetical protein
MLRTKFLALLGFLILVKTANSLPTNTSSGTNVQFIYHLECDDGRTAHCESLGFYCDRYGRFQFGGDWDIFDQDCQDHCDCEVDCIGTPRGKVNIKN